MPLVGTWARLSGKNVGYPISPVSFKRGNRHAVLLNGKMQMGGFDRFARNGIDDTDLVACLYLIPLFDGRALVQAAVRGNNSGRRRR